MTMLSTRAVVYVILLLMQFDWISTPPAYVFINLIAFSMRFKWMAISSAHVFRSSQLQSRQKSVWLCRGHENTAEHCNRIYRSCKHTVTTVTAAIAASDTLSAGAGIGTALLLAGNSVTINELLKAQHQINRRIEEFQLLRVLLKRYADILSYPT